MHQDVKCSLRPPRVPRKITTWKPHSRGGEGRGGLQTQGDLSCKLKGQPGLRSHADNTFKYLSPVIAHTLCGIYGHWFISQPRSWQVGYACLRRATSPPTSPCLQLRSVPQLPAHGGFRNGYKDNLWSFHRKSTLCFTPLRSPKPWETATLRFHFIGNLITVPQLFFRCPLLYANHNSEEEENPKECAL